MKPDAKKILVTGATGFLGRRLVEILTKRKYEVKALARKQSSTEKLKNLPVEILFGDVSNINTLRPLFKGIDIVVHAAADTTGKREESEVSTIQGTRNFLELCREINIKKLVYISSCSVYGISDYEEGQLVTESSSLERFPEKRGLYSYAKLKAEELVTAAMLNWELPIVCLRPGTIYGPGGGIYSPMMGFAFGKWVFAIFGNGQFILPLVYIDNLVDAIIQSIEKDESTGKIFNVVDQDDLTKKQYVDRLLKKYFPEPTISTFHAAFCTLAFGPRNYLLGCCGSRHS